MKLNDAQQAAVDCIDGPCLVLAGAGSGKTRVITNKIVSLIKEHYILPQSILAVTFTNKAALEMKDRVKGQLGKEVSSKITISTFHSLGLIILKEDYAHVGLNRNFTLFDQYDSLKIIRDIVRDQHPEILIDNSEKSVIEDVTAEISYYKTNLLRPEDIKTKTVKADIYASYTAYLQACNAADFEDLIFKTTLMLNENEEMRKKWSTKFEYILVDEYQDTNETQYQLLKALTSMHKKFTVVGDDDQSIYAWRGARPENIKVLANDYPNLKVIKLEQNYRSTEHILNCANELISHNDHIFDKKLFTKSNVGSKVKIMELRTEAQMADRVVSLILSEHYQSSAPWSDFAILYRSNAQSRTIEKALHSARIPCLISGGTSFYEQVEIKDMMSWCRVVCNPYDDMALLRVINIPRRGIGHETINTILEQGKALGKSVYEAALIPSVTDKLNQKQKKALCEFILLLTKLRQYILNENDKELSEKMVEMIGYNAYLKANTYSNVAAEIKVKNVDTLMTWIQDIIVGKNGSQKLSFIEAIDKLGLREMMDRNRDNEQNDAVQLMTLHASKGLEFPFVYLVGMQEGTLPHKNSIEDLDAGIEDNIAEERRLAYVGITRAKKDLTLLLAREANSRGGVPKAVTPSRFLKELPLKDIEYYPLGTQVTHTKEEYKDFLDIALSSLKTQK